jgi:hypothetical protein
MAARIRKELRAHVAEHDADHHGIWEGAVEDFKFGEFEQAAEEAWRAGTVLSVGEAVAYALQLP